MLEGFEIDTPRPKPAKTGLSKSAKILIGVLSALLVAVLAVVAWLALSIGAKDAALNSERTARQQAELDREQALMMADYNELQHDLTTLEDQRIQIMDDSVKRDLMEKYEAARLRVEQLQRQLQEQRSLSAAEIERLKGEIATLREILRNYLQQIDQLNQENQQLRQENHQLQSDNDRLTSQVTETSQQNQVLSERMELAEKLNVTNVSLYAMKGSKTEKKVSKAKQLVVSFTIPQNNSTPVGEKTIFLRIISPSGQLLGNGGNFAFEGTSLLCTAKTTIDYAGEEIGGVSIYYDIDTTLGAGDYTVELFTDGYRLCSKSLHLN